MNSTKSNSSKKNTESKGIKRRNFLGYLGLSAISMFFISRIPGKLFGSNIGAAVSENKSAKRKTIIIKENTLAVKRTGRNSVTNG